MYRRLPAARVDRDAQGPGPGSLDDQVLQRDRRAQRGVVLRIFGADPHALGLVAARPYGAARHPDLCLPAGHVDAVLGRLGRRYGDIAQKRRAAIDSLRCRDCGGGAGDVQQAQHQRSARRNLKWIDGVRLRCTIPSLVLPSQHLFG